VRDDQVADDLDVVVFVGGAEVGAHGRVGRRGGLDHHYQVQVGYDLDHLAAEAERAERPVAALGEGPEQVAVAVVGAVLRPGRGLLGGGLGQPGGGDELAALPAAAGQP
jgi:hypothetical protein